MEINDQTASDDSLRGRITSKTSQYYIINELLGLAYMKLLSAVKLKEKNNEQINKDKYTILYLSKDYLKKIIFKNQTLPPTVEKNIYQNIQNTFVTKSKVKHINIQEMMDYCETDKGIYFVMENCDMPLYDYISQLREFCSIKKEPIEFKLRSMFMDMITFLGFVHDQGLHMCGLIDIRQMYIQLKEDEIIVKFLHPILSTILTLLKVYSNESDFASFFAPELYAKLVNQKDIENKILNNDSLYVASDILMGIQPLFAFDYWSLGVLFYEMIFGKPPHKFNSLKDANEFNENKVYTIEISAITFEMLQLITMCLKYHTGKRFNINSNEIFLREFSENNLNEKEIEKEIKRRKETYKEGTLKYFNYLDDSELMKSK